MKNQNMAESCLVVVNNMPDDTPEYVVARWSKETSGLWYWGSWDNEAQANEIAKMIDGVVVRRVKA